MPFISLFISSLILGSLLSISSTHWVFIWVGLELNLMSFIPLLCQSNQSNEAEAAMKYFLAQTLGSGLILLGSLSLFTSPLTLFTPNFMNLLLFLGLITKLGLPPCHFWFPSVMSLISWPMCIILTTWQKLVPMLLLFYILTPNMNLIVFSVIILSSLLGGLGGLNQTQLRPLLAYSSIGHMSWMIAASTSSYSVSLIYMLIYILTTIPLMLLLWFSSSSSQMISTKLSFMSLPLTFSLFLLMMSLGGVPPLLGFFPKWMVMETLNSSFIMIIFITLMGSMINLYYYLNLLFINILTPPHLTLKYNSQTTQFTATFLPLMTTLSLGLGPLMFLFIYALTILY